jgi:hypothetical protein
MSWYAALLALLLSHAVGDVLFQTDWQALNKVRGFADPLARRALVHHIATYTVAFIPALVWIGSHTDAGRAVLVGVAVSIPHFLIDDGRVVKLWLREVKRAPRPGLALTIAVDQSLHLVCLLGAALLAAA